MVFKIVLNYWIIYTTWFSISSVISAIHYVLPMTENNYYLLYVIVKITITIKCYIIQKFTY